MPFNSPQYQKRRKSPADDKTCYVCRKIGHWAPECNKARIQSSSDQQSVFRSRMQNLGLEELSQFQPVIMCGCGESRRRLISGSEKNRGKFYYRECGCGEIDFKWDDQVEAEDKIWVPKCKCKAGFCRVSVKKFGPDAGRKVFKCLIKEGQGQCEFGQLVEETVLQVPMIYDEDEIPNNSSPADVRTGKDDDMVMGTADNPILHTLPHSHQLPQPPRPPSSSPSSLSKRRKRLDFDNDLFIEEEEDSGSAVKNGKRPCSGDNSFPGTSNRDSIVRYTVSECSKKTAKNLQNKLISVLESMDFHNHEAMVEEANTTFDALNQSKITIQPAFRLKVDNFIECASSLSRIDSSVSDREKDMADLEARKRLLEMLDKNVAIVMEKLFEIEAELFCLKAENEKLESRYAAFNEAKILLRS